MHGGKLTADRLITSLEIGKGCCAHQKNHNILFNVRLNLTSPKFIEIRLGIPE